MKLEPLFMKPRATPGHPRPPLISFSELLTEFHLKRGELTNLLRDPTHPRVELSHRSSGHYYPAPQMRKWLRLKLREREACRSSA